MAIPTKIPPTVVIFSDIHKDSKVTTLRRLVEASCGSSIYSLVFNASPKDLYYNLLFDGDAKDLSGVFFLVEFTSASSLSPAIHLAPTGHLNRAWRVKLLTTDEEYAKLCGYLNVEKERGEALQYFIADSVRTTVLISNLDAKVTGTELMRFFRFVGVILDGVIVRDQQKALVSFQTKSQGSVACSCDGAIMGSKPISVVLYDVNTHGRELLKFMSPDGYSASSQMTAYFQLREVLSSSASPSSSSNAPPTSNLAHLNLNPPSSKVTTMNPPTRAGNPPAQQQQPNYRQVSASSSYHAQQIPQHYNQPQYSQQQQHQYPPQQHHPKSSSQYQHPSNQPSYQDNKSYSQQNVGAQQPSIQQQQQSVSQHHKYALYPNSQQPQQTQHQQPPSQQQQPAPSYQPPQSQLAPTKYQVVMSESVNPPRQDASSSSVSPRSSEPPLTPTKYQVITQARK